MKTESKTAKPKQGDRQTIGNLTMICCGISRDGVISWIPENSQFLSAPNLGIDFVALDLKTRNYRNPFDKAAMLAAAKRDIIQHVEASDPLAKALMRYQDWQEKEPGKLLLKYAIEQNYVLESNNNQFRFCLA